MAIPRIVGKMLTPNHFDGQFDYLHGSTDRLQFFAMDLEEPIHFDGWPNVKSIYIHDTRVRNGTFPQENDYLTIQNLIPLLREKKTEIINRINMWPDGHPVAAHLFGGAFHIGNVAFIRARHNEHPTKKYLLAKLY